MAAEVEYKDVDLVKSQRWCPRAVVGDGHLCARLYSVYDKGVVASCLGQYCASQKIAESIAYTVTSQPQRL